jgi:hypothetical protein
VREEYLKGAMGFLSRLYRCVIGSESSVQVSPHARLANTADEAIAPLRCGNEGTYKLLPIQQTISEELARADGARLAGISHDCYVKGQETAWWRRQARRCRAGWRWWTKLATRLAISAAVDGGGFRVLICKTLHVRILL